MISSSYVKLLTLVAVLFGATSIVEGFNTRLVANKRGSMVVTATKKNKLSGRALIKSSLHNKGMSYTQEERAKYKLEGLLPGGDPISLDDKVEIAMEQMDKKSTPLEKYIHLHTIQDADETLYYAILAKHTKKAMPFVYTPTVGEACQEWSRIYRHTPRGLYISLKDKGRIKELLANQPNKDISTIVVTDGERILGLGDLGVNGMGIPIGKLALYTACAGIHPAQCLPVHIDVGTNREALHTDKSYMGLKQKRDRSPAYDELIEEFVTACQETYGRNVLIQFEDFGNSNAFRLLEKYRERANCFNDDIQGTAAVALAGLMASHPLTKKKDLTEHRFLFYGAGEAGIGIANLVSAAIAKEGNMPIEEARKHCFFVDSTGLITDARLKSGAPAGFAGHKKPYAHDISKFVAESPEKHDISKLADVVNLLKPTALIGVSAQGGAFCQTVVESMARINPNPIIFALSNPTHKAECTAADAYLWTKGKAVFSSGSPFDDVVMPDGKIKTPGQGNNAYIFPGLGLGSLVSAATSLTDDDMYIAAAKLATLVPKDRLKSGSCYPSLDSIREVSQHIAAAVAKNIFASGRSSLPSGPKWQTSFKSILKRCAKITYTPEYPEA